MSCAFRLKKIDPFRPTKTGRGCQFADFEKALIDTPAGAGERWCPFHLPTLWGGKPTLKDEQWRQGKGLDNFNNKIFDFINETRKWDKPADLSGVIFPGTISFSQYTKESSLREASFTKAKFEGNTSFSKTHFVGIASFKDAIFSDDASFDKANFADGVSFLGVSFDGIASFTKAYFGGKADFGDIASPGVKFRGNASFDEANFADGVSFLGVSFDGIASFTKAYFGGDADFSIVMVVHEGTQGTAHTFHRAMFSGAKFGGVALFHNRTFLSTTDFGGANFAHAPEFHGGTLHQNTIFPPAKNFRERKGANAARAYRTLKYAMASVHARDEEAKFYALEQKSLRASSDMGLWERLFSWLYEWTADYGQSFMRPLCLLFAIFFLFSGFYALFLLLSLEPWSNFVFPPIHCADVLRFSLQQVFRPFEVFRASGAPTGDVMKAFPPVPLLLTLLAAFHSLLTLSFLALFLLALRRRFRLN